jgi:transposase
MSNTFVNRDLGLRDYQLVKTERRKNEIYYHLHDPKPICPACQSENVARDGVTPRTIRVAGVENKLCYAVVQMPRVHCRDCNARRRGKIRFTDQNKSYSRTFERNVLKHVNLASSLEDVAKHVGYDWHVVKEIHKQDLKRDFAKTPLKKLKNIAIDEIYLGKKLKYRTVVLDLDTGAIVYVGMGRDAESLDPFWKSLNSSGARVKAVAMDMSRAYMAAVTKNLPKAQIVFDPFHVIKSS